MSEFNVVLIRSSAISESEAQARLRRVFEFLWSETPVTSVAEMIEGYPSLKARLADDGRRDADARESDGDGAVVPRPRQKEQRRLGTGAGDPGRWRAVQPAIAVR